MQPIVPNYSGPQATAQAPGTKDYKQLHDTVKSLVDWSQSLTLKLNSQFGLLQTVLNGQPLVGSTLPSAGSLTISSSIHHITGTSTINTITPVGAIIGQVTLIADGAFSLGNAGNIAVTAGPFVPGTSVVLTYDPSTGLWYPQIPGSNYTTNPAAPWSYAQIQYGSWTPVLLAAGGNPAPNYAAQYGRFMYINPGLVHLIYYMAWNGYSGGNAGGQAVIGGNPGWPCSNWEEGYIGNSSGATTTPIGIQIQQGTPTLTVVYTHDGSATALSNWNPGVFGQMLGFSTYATY